MDDVSSGAAVGFGLSDANAHEGRRQSAADAYLRPFTDRPNLHIVTDSAARNLFIHDGVCTGVEYGDGVVSAPSPWRGAR